MGYHVKQISKGVCGEVSKIQEEFEEFLDAHDQNVVIMELVELSDLIGAIELYILKHYNLKLMDLIKMSNKTKEAFIDGSRN